ncbi:MAG: hypothetical protein BM557_01240 [Flavobacterium sp. MedPE-SWcel]|uniref:N-acetylmuramoyl-L-alanine amidase n=1 Tax=uncultured Flavobacterium sp. TaxID=165435 RepID=UPI00091B79BD|nr:N-acetylmuramoyl-L-alanine amidase [uncultured Flavobacterium sp.]OIQ22031.1 MAG: hypothetical protein BM557_01240 [Flavobacterium sp. MedPE-SWcel]
MSRAKKIKYITVHCSAGFSGIKAIKAFWKRLGWRSPGYHILINRNGKVHQLHDFNRISNGVRGYNTQCINICYIGGVEKTAAGKYIGKDTRTPEQKEALENEIIKAIEWVKNNGGNIEELSILGHRDFSPDVNGNNVIESFERIKECPSFNAIQEYKHLLDHKKIILPSNR